MATFHVRLTVDLVVHDAVSADNAARFARDELYTSLSGHRAPSLSLSVEGVSPELVTTRRSR